MQGGGSEELSIEELASNLSTYKDQLQQVRKLLDDDPGNSEYVDMEKELAEVISLTEELLATAKQSENSVLNIGIADYASPSLNNAWGSSEHDKEPRSMSDLSDRFPVGTKVQAVWSDDGEWYDATIEAITPNGYFVCYDGWGNKEEVDPANVRPVEEGVVNALLEAEKVAEATKQDIKRKIAQAAASDFQSRTLPEKLRIDPNDPEDVIGFFSGRKKESIFKSPEDPNGKVGVTGSGKGLTDFQKREKHLHLKGANGDSGDE
ncbi:hypothetical protein TEA_019596 [Camellia sinensis var. sinensis]|uniref:Survival of motor neuron-related-splicing factor 30 n=1 Tax=Camellia sinensis var. sinensis TaxID=542762 RepID=A0A4S4EX36_CAMSN|nr:hypothetical protein TEA_019596 [Camellia sinensis var. sinensis]